MVRDLAWIWWDVVHVWIGWNAPSSSVTVHFSTSPAHRWPLIPMDTVPHSCGGRDATMVKGSGLRAFRGKCLLSKRRRIRVSHLFPSGHAAPISHKEVAWLVYQTEIKAPAKRHTASLQGPRVCLHIPLGWRDSISARCGLRQSTHKCVPGESSE